jgi:hypothetical protein
VLPPVASKRASQSLDGVLPDALNSLGHPDFFRLRQRLFTLAGLTKVRDHAPERIPLAKM